MGQSSSKPDEELLEKHSRAGRIEEVIRLLTGGTCDLAGPAGSAALVKAAEQGRHLCVECLLLAGTDVNGTKYDGKVTPLIAATSKNRVSAMRALLRAGASLTPTTIVGMSVMDAGALASGEANRLLKSAPRELAAAAERRESDYTKAQLLAHSIAVHVIDYTDQNG